MHQEMVPVLNDIFIKTADEDINKVKSMVDIFIQSRVTALGRSDISDINSSFDKVGNLITLSISGTCFGNRVEGSKNWTTKEILSENRPMTSIFESLINEVFSSI